jgi:hypothetical protein
LSLPPAILAVSKYGIPLTDFETMQVIHGRQIFFRGGVVKLVDPIFDGHFFSKKKIPTKLVFFLKNKTENAFSPLPARTACLPLQDCIVQTTSLPAYGRKFLPPRWSPDNKATGRGLRPDNSAAALHAYSRRYMEAARLQWQVLKLQSL